MVLIYYGPYPVSKGLFEGVLSFFTCVFKAKLKGNCGNFAIVPEKALAHGTTLRQP